MNLERIRYVVPCSQEGNNYVCLRESFIRKVAKQKGEEFFYRIKFNGTFKETKDLIKILKEMDYATFDDLIFNLENPLVGIHVEKQVIF